MRRSDGTGGQTQLELTAAINILNSDYQPYGISFTLIGTDEIKNTTYYNYTSISSFLDINGLGDPNGDGKFDLFSINTHTNAIDIYLFANDKLSGGISANIPGTSLAIGGNAYNTNLASSHVLSHEMGHCLGLFHTFHGTSLYYEPNGCQELVNGSNGTTCGDFVQDTPADPTHIFDCGTQSTCTWNCSSSFIDANGAHYNPNTHLFMAYTYPNCMTSHTVGQVSKMFSVIANSCLLQHVIYMEVSGSTTVCTSGTTFTVFYVPTDCFVSWTCSNNITFDNQPGNPKAFTAIGSGTGTITATINSTTCGALSLPTKTVATGSPPSSIVTSNISNLQDMGYDQPYYKILSSYGVYAFEGTLTASSIGSTGGTWSFVSGITGKNFAYWSASNNTVDVGAKTGNAGEVLRYTATNTCGSSSATYTFFTGTINVPPPLIITPNPASTQTEISVPEITNDTNMQTAATTQNTYTISVMNSNGISVYSASGGEKKITVPTSTLKNGIYIVRVSDGKNIFQGNLVVNH